MIVPVNSWGRPDDVAYTVEDSGARLVFCDQARYDGVAERFRDKGIQSVIARPTQSGDPDGLASFVADHIGSEPAPVDIDSDDLAMIMYTSGTSGKPKGAASTHRAICQALYNMECAAMAAAMTNGETITAMLEKGFEPTSLLAVPLFHVSGCHAQFLANLRGGRRIVMMYKWDVERALEYIERERVTTIAAAPSMMLDLLDDPRFATADTSSPVLARDWRGCHTAQGGPAAGGETATEFQRHRLGHDRNQRPGRLPDRPCLRAQTGQRRFSPPGGGPAYLRRGGRAPARR